MPLTLTWSDFAVRLACTVIAGFLVGLDRDERENPPEYGPTCWYVWPRRSR